MASASVVVCRVGERGIEATSSSTAKLELAGFPPPVTAATRGVAGGVCLPPARTCSEEHAPAATAAITTARGPL